MRGKYIQSRYNSYYKVEGISYGYNAMNNTFIELRDPWIQENIQNIERIEEKNYDLFKKLCEAGFYISENYDERKDFLKKYMAIINNETICNLTLVPDLKCNLECPYCFQNRVENTQLNKLAADRLISFLRNKISKDPIKFLIVRYYGGEPLMNFEILHYFHQNLMDLCEKHSVQVQTSIFTNGTLIKEETLRNFEELDIYNIYISIDNYRIQNKKMFSTLINILKNAKEFTKLKLNLRINVDHQYKDTIDSLAPLIQQLNLKQYINMQIEPIFEYSPHSVNLENIRYKFKALRYLLETYDLLLIDFPRKKLVNCYTSMKNSLLVDPLLNLYSCHQHFGEIDKAIGKLSGDTWNLPSKFIAGELFSQPCMDCIYLPICLGECTNLVNEDYIKNGCRYNEDYLLNYFELLYEARKLWYNKNDCKFEDYYISQFG